MKGIAESWADVNEHITDEAQSMATAAGDESSSQVWEGLGHSQEGPMACAKRCGCHLASTEEPPKALHGECTVRNKYTGIHLEVPDTSFINGGKCKSSKQIEFGSKGNKENRFGSSQTRLLSLVNHSCTEP